MRGEWCAGQGDRQQQQILEYQDVHAPTERTFTVKTQIRTARLQITCKRPQTIVKVFYACLWAAGRS